MLRNRLLFRMLLISIALTILNFTFLHYKMLTVNTRRDRDEERCRRNEIATTSNSSWRNAKKNICLLKTHKTASSTLQNILTRYAITHNLFVGLPATSFNFKSVKGKRFNRKFMMEVPPNRSLNMLLHHMRFNKTEIEAIMPKDTVYLTILREPSAQFESAFTYYGTLVKSFLRFQKLENPISEWLANPKKSFIPKGPQWWTAKNHMFYDLGFDNMIENEDYINTAIADMEETYDLVLIMEYLDISLILMAEILNWSLEDMAHIQQNVRAEASKRTMNPELSQKIRKWNKADSALYAYFNRTLWKRVREYGMERLGEDLQKFNRIQISVRQCCFGGKVPNLEVNDSILMAYNPRGVQIVTTIFKKEMKNNKTCQLMAYPEMTLFKELFKLQYPKKNYNYVKAVVP